MMKRKFYFFSYPISFHIVDVFFRYSERLNRVGIIRFSPGQSKIVCDRVVFIIEIPTTHSCLAGRDLMGRHRYNIHPLISLPSIVDVHIWGYRKRFSSSEYHARRVMNQYK